MSCDLQSAAQLTTLNRVVSSFTSHAEFSMLSTLGHPSHPLPRLDCLAANNEEDHRSCHACEQASFLPFGRLSVCARLDIALSA
ncbi:hypothetical protein EUGRSUZ_D00563 [Eucalyptus grandis]|uniref:Uncharacterized protein n=1 Tax=Eucalyptus grandis TaxID=71139 RepID=A0A059CE04_EUCGR|nr:hypothetical protein EUGRSUZ_D00563 [Eucalyptus grandis]